MKIYLNGNPHELENSVSVDTLLEKVGLAGKPVVVELNETAVFPRDYSEAMVEAGARVEIVTLAAGG